MSKNYPYYESYYNNKAHKVASWSVEEVNKLKSTKLKKLPIKWNINLDKLENIRK